ncbi:TonB-dependent receptor [uncultured Kriegella sp.]|uniref:TonB-dependent receptor domain-containing protein n=1 Tax=uncultured Kriegella sp. TaxID=1798910 RepID=UPI0030DD3601
MIPSKVCSFLIVVVFYGSTLVAQHTLSGRVISVEDNGPMAGAEVYDQSTGIHTLTDANGQFSLSGLNTGEHHIAIFSYGYTVWERRFEMTADSQIEVVLEPLGINLPEVVITLQRQKVFALRQLKKVEGTAIYAGKKTEVVALEGITANLAANNARQIYNQVVGLNIYDNGDAGLQLNIGGRGLDPNRSQNFNTRQNGYDISADVLGYPESYYTPPPEALSEIQIVRGAASLQYGTQFGGLVNFVFKKPNPVKKVELVSRQSVGSNALFTSFNSLSGTVGRFSYYTYYNYKKGDGFRPNSHFDSHNAFAHLGWQLTDKTKLEVEYTFLDYLAQQPGGLTDAQFYENPDYSNRERNWFAVNWNLYALKLKHQLTPSTDFSFNFFGLDASRKALGYRQNRVSQSDDTTAPRELLIDDFSNWGAETRLLTRYGLLKNKSVLLVGAKYYHAKNQQQQGPGSAAMDADFTLADDEFPNYDRQAAFTFPNRNLAFFGENIFNINSRFSITPGFRLEFLKTESEGTYNNVFLDLAGNVLLNETLEDNREFKRNFMLLGVGGSYKLSKNGELYANVSQNYRSVTFNDIRVVNPVYQVDPDITDEKGFTADIGLRGNYNGLFSYDASVFGLRYNNRIGEVLKTEERPNAQGELVETGRVVRFRGNIGDAFIYGVEVFGDWSLKETFFKGSDNYKLNFFVNAAFTQSEYTASEENNVKGNEVEFIPAVNLKTGINFGYKNLLGGLQYSYLSEQFTDATNAPQDKQDSQRGIEGEIPAYDILDFSTSYTFKKWKLEAGINNVLDNSYFTRRATGYPGPGIIPAQPRTFYTTLQFKF